MKKRKPIFLLFLAAVVLLASVLPGAPAMAQASAPVVYAANTGFSNVQGQGQWSYQKLVGGEYSDLSFYNASSNRWQAQEASPVYPWMNRGEMHPGNTADAVRTWTAPGAGIVDITGGVRKGDSNGDGVLASVKKNGTTLWSVTVSNNTPTEPSGVTAISVAQGDRITFEVNKIGTLNNDHTFWVPVVSFTAAGGQDPGPDPEPEPDPDPVPAPGTIHWPVTESVNTRGGASGDTDHANTNQKLRVPAANDPASGTEFWVKARSVEGAPDPVNTREGYLKVPFTAYYAADSVTLNVYHKEALDRDVPVTLRGLSDSSWNENELTWNNAPAEEGELLGTLVIREAGWYAYDVTDYANAVIAQGGNVLSFRLTDDSDADLNVKFASGSAPLRRPYLAYAGEPPLTDGGVNNLPESFYDRPGLENMPKLDYAGMKVANVRDFGAAGNGIANDRAAFDQAVDALMAEGGGIVYMPAGRYLFAPTTPPGATPTDRRFWDRTGERELRNIHFVGEGEATTVVFHNPGIAALASGQEYDYRNGAYAGGRPYGWRLAGDNYSLRSFNTSWSTRMDMRTINGPYNLGLSGENIQVTDLHIDQGGIGVVFWQGSKNIWAVDNTVVNTGADGIHFANTVDVVAAYNYVENSNDDAIGFVSDAPGANNWPISENNYALYNTIVRTPWGRGISAGGKGHVIEHNWVESSLLSGIFTNSLGQGGVSGIPVEDVSISHNTIWRADQNNRPDNNNNMNHVYKGAIAMNNNATNVTIENNGIYSNPGNGIFFSAWSSALQGRNLKVIGNEIARAGASGIRINNNAVIDGLEIRDNELLGNGSSVQFGGSLTGEQLYSGNRASQPTTPEREGFQVVTNPPPAADAFDGMASEPSETGWAEPANAPVSGDVFDVTDYGAAGDGTTNDTPAFQAALNAIPASGGILYVPAGTYSLSPIGGSDGVANTAIRHHLLAADKSNVHIVGEGEASVLRFASSGHQGLRLLGLADSSVRSLSLELAIQPSQRHNRALLDISASTNIEVEDVSIRRSGGPGLATDASTRVAVTDSRIADSGTSGIELLASRQIQVTDTVIDNSRDSGIHVNKLGTIAREPQYIRISGNAINGSRDYTGVGIAAGNHIEVSDNEIRDTHLAGINVYYSSEAYFADKVKITGNTLTNVNSGPYTYHYGAITVIRSLKGNIEISGNTIDTTPYAGVTIDASTLTGLQIGQNTFRAVGGDNVRRFNSTIVSEVDLDKQIHVTAVTPRPVKPGDWTKWALDATLENDGSLPASGAVRLVGPAEWADEVEAASFEQLAPNGSTVITFDLPVTPPDTGTVPIELSLVLSNGAESKVTRNVNFMAAAETDQAPTIDGVLDGEWNDAMPFKLQLPSQYKTVSGGSVPWGGADDLSAVGYAKWDETNLYVAVSARDNVHKQGSADGSAWAGDSLQLMVDPGREAGPGSAGYNELLFALSDEGDIVKWRWAAVAGHAAGSLDHSEASIVRDEQEGTTVYEIAIPWTELLPAGTETLPGMIGFSLLINDDDGPGRHGWLEYMSGIGTGKNPNLFGELVLAEQAEDPIDPVDPEQPGNPGSGTGGPPVAQQPVINVTEDGTAVITFGDNGSLNDDGVGAKLSKQLWNQAWAAAKGDKKAVSVKLPSKDGATEFVLTIPADALQEMPSGGRLEIVTSEAAITIPGSIRDLLQADGAEEVSLVISLTDKTGLLQSSVNPSVKKAISAQWSADGKKLDLTGGELRYKVVIPYKANQREGAEPEKLAIWQIGGDGKAVGIPNGRYDAETGTMTFAASELGTFMITFRNASFQDMNGYGWASNAAETLAAKGVVFGMTATTFAPNQSVTRGDFMLLLVRMLGLTGDGGRPFADVHPGDYYYDAVGIARSLGIATGTGGNSFEPDQPITRQDMAALIIRALNASAWVLPSDSSQPAKELDGFGDTVHIAPYAKESLAHLLEAGVIQGTSENRIEPVSFASRAEAAVMLYRILKNAAPAANL